MMDFLIKEWQMKAGNHLPQSKLAIMIFKVFFSPFLIGGISDFFFVEKKKTLLFYGDAKF